MTYEEFFAEVKEQFQKADVSHVTEHLAYQFNIVGGCGRHFLCGSKRRQTLC